MYLDPKRNDGDIVQTGFETLFDEAREARERKERWESDIVPLLSTLRGLLSWGHVKSVVFHGSKDYALLTLGLEREHKDSPLAREIAQAFHAKGEKLPSYEGDSLRVEFEVGGVSLTIEGYLPPTCRIVETVEYIPAHTGTVRKVVCTEEGESGNS